jgi:hypothetical protein
MRFAQSGLAKCMATAALQHRHIALNQSLLLKASMT